MEIQSMKIGLCGYYLCGWGFFIKNILTANEAILYFLRGIKIPLRFSLN